MYQLWAAAEVAARSRKVVAPQLRVVIEAGPAPSLLDKAATGRPWGFEKGQTMLNKAHKKFKEKNLPRCYLRSLIMNHAWNENEENNKNIRIIIPNQWMGLAVFEALNIPQKELCLDIA